MTLEDQQIIYWSKGNEFPAAAQNLFKNDKKKVAETIYGFYTSKGYKMSPETFNQAIGTVEVNVTFPPNLRQYMQEQADILLREKKIKQIPDWSKALRPDFMQKAKA